METKEVLRAQADAKQQARREKTFKSSAFKRTPAKKGSRSRRNRKFWTWSGDTLYIKRCDSVYNSVTGQYEWHSDVDDSGKTFPDVNARDKRNNRLETSYVEGISERKNRVRSAARAKRLLTP
jgi:hypothetical protein